jgi:hypothetical protein
MKPPAGSLASSLDRFDKKCLNQGRHFGAIGRAAEAIAPALDARQQSGGGATVNPPC